MAVAADLHRDFLIPECAWRIRQRRQMPPDELRYSFCRTIIAQLLGFGKRKHKIYFEFCTKGLSIVLEIAFGDTENALLRRWPCRQRPGFCWENLPFSHTVVALNEFLSVLCMKSKGRRAVAFTPALLPRKPPKTRSKRTKPFRAMAKTPCFFTPFAG